MARSKGQKSKRPETPERDRPAEAAEAAARTIHLDGKTLEGGGQLVRNALALSALTAKPITITNIRGNRRGKTGLKGSHAAAVKSLVETCGGEVTGGEIGSTTLTFFPRGRSAVDDDGDQLSLAFTHPWSGQPPIRPEYNIRLSTAGSIFLIFQALYPYLLHASSFGSVGPVRLNITGGTNVSCAPSYDYEKQVFVPNLQRLGFPRLSVNLRDRGWSTGPMNLGTVTFTIHPLGSDKATESQTDAQPDGPNGVDGTATEEEQKREVDGEYSPSQSRFPLLNLGHYRRGKITKVDITILAPDTSLRGREFRGDRKRERKDKRRSHESRQYDSSGNTEHLESDESAEWDERSPESMTVREYLEEKALKAVARALKRLPESVIPRRSSSNDSHVDGDSSNADTGISIPIKTHTSETTHHHTHLYILLVAHTSNGFKLGRDALFEGFGKRGRRTTGKHGQENRNSNGGSGGSSVLDELVERCVEGFVEELHPDELPQGADDGQKRKKHKPCVDAFMRDQLVIFEALGRVQSREKADGDVAVSDGKDKADEEAKDEDEDERYWSLHTQTARWVCEKILGEDIWL
ncbi:hypothetical protein VTN96DRAFT_4536 [Rasamsonia emersonii]|uniref:RNA 3'-terminal phosphate cyclase n=1 Tax=Rasamsonia emersonii (strain ATCC 16479 / CBS 393.64 / IMI 116815) TaxID=1408163 RepID=A0A0F4YT41_RASE3|nr:RNA 3'-terminal phosphate cyclase [Rasamsonia emersonii CBS 393.64]KKA21409.1 RNA 3'-terminal phosphate cyclase [Rasamsonia emersonii CBS 393.64]